MMSAGTNINIVSTSNPHVAWAPTPHSPNLTNERIAQIFKELERNSCARWLAKRESRIYKGLCGRLCKLCPK